jgi:two-component system LytT family response regulator
VSRPGELRAVVVDDEPLARQAVAALLAADGEVALAGEASGADAVDLVARARPDILFLDIQMPGLDGFGVLERLGPDAMPAVVFVTAYDRYALRAFEVHALDYLLKPFDDRRFAAALARAKERARARRPGERDEALAALLRRRGAPTRFLVPQREKVVAVDAAQIDWIESADGYVSLHVSGPAGKAEHLLRETMDAVEARLDPERFCRVHRTAIVNVDRVREVHPLFHGDAELVLADGTRVRLSRSRRKEFEALFAGSHPSR